MALTDARARHPDLIALPDRSGSRFVPFWSASADWARRLPLPLLAQDPPDALVLDMTGAAHLFGGEGSTPCRYPRRRPDRDGLHSPVSPLPARRRPPLQLTRRKAQSDGWARSDHRKRHRGKRPCGLCRCGPARRSRDLRGAGADGPAPGSRIFSLRPRAPFAARFGRGSARAHPMRLWDACASGIGAPARIEAPAPILPSAVSSSRFWPVRMSRARWSGWRKSSTPCSLNPRHGEGATRPGIHACFVSMCAVRRISLQSGRPVRDRGRTGIMLLFREKLAGLHDALDVGHGFEFSPGSAPSPSGALTKRASGLTGVRSRGQALARLIDTSRRPARRGNACVYPRCLAMRICREEGRAPAPPVRSPLFRAHHRPVPQPVLAPWLPPSSCSPPPAPDRPIRLFDQSGTPIEALAGGWA